jgi:L-alanine-DL-glutamate epimerase-like enolase superfamily enzyme
MGSFQEYKGNIEQTGQWYDPPLRLKDGAINVPAGPGLGIVADVLRNAQSL